MINLDSSKSPSRKNPTDSPTSFVPPPRTSPSSLSDEALHQEVTAIGRDLLLTQRRFGGRIYLVHRRGIPQKNGFKDIFEYAARLGGLTRKKVGEILRIGNHLEKTPRLMDLFVQGRVPWTKLKIVASHVSPETDSLWADRVQRLTRDGLEALIQDTKRSPSRRGPMILSGSAGQGAEAGRAIGGGQARSTSETPGTGRVERGEPPAAGEPGSVSRHPEARGAGSPDPALDPGSANSSGGLDRFSHGRTTGGPTGPADPGVSGQAGDREFSDAGEEFGDDEFKESRIGLQLDPLVANRFLGNLTLASRRMGRRLSQSDFLMMLLAQYEHSRPARTRYLEVVLRDDATRKAWVETAWGPMPVDDEDLAERERQGDPLDLDEEFSKLEMKTNEEQPLESGSDRPDPSKAPKKNARGKSGQSASGGKSRAVSSRYIPARLYRLIIARDGGLCAVPGCRRPYWAIHHQERFALSEQNDPTKMWSVCDKHHELLHAGLIENEEEPPTRWIVSVQGRDETSPEIEAVDRLAREYRQKAFAE